MAIRQGRAFGGEDAGDNSFAADWAKWVDVAGGADRTRPNPYGPNAGNPDYASMNPLLIFRPGDSWYSELVANGVQPDANGVIEVASNDLAGLLPGRGIGEADEMSAYGPAIASIAFGGAAGLAGGAGGGATTTGLSAADTAGLAQMGADAGLSGNALNSFVASGGTLGLTAAGGGGVGLGALSGGTGETSLIGDPALDELSQGYDVSQNASSSIDPNTPPPSPAPAPTPYTNWDAALGGTGAATGAAATSLIPGISDQVLSGVAQAGLGLAGANIQADALEDVAAQQAGIGQWARDLNQASYTDPNFDLWNQPGYQDAFQNASDMAAKSVSAQYGNPYGNPGAMGAISNQVLGGQYLPALANYRGGLLQAGGMGLNTSGQASLMGAQNAGAGLDAIGYGVGTALAKDPWEEIRKMYGGQQPNFALSVGGNSYK